MERILADVEKLCFDKELFPILEKVEKGERLTFEDGMAVMGTEDLNTVGMLADYVKRQRVGDKVYFVVNRHINPSNICAISCRFCISDDMVSQKCSKTGIDLNVHVKSSKKINLFDTFSFLKTEFLKTRFSTIPWRVPQNAQC